MDSEQEEGKSEQGPKQLEACPLKMGVDCISASVRNLPATPGVYRMIGVQEEVLYVGKAKSLKARVASYTRPSKLTIRIQRMIAQTRRMEFVHTKTEAEALLLESSLIKKLKPRYNILLRDDKSFPYIHLGADHDFPLVQKHRGPRKKAGQYFGPFAGAGDVNRTIAILQRVFLLRNCSDNVFASRTRPCLQYHIKRCTAPCVGLVGKADYAEQVAQAEAFLRGESRALQQRFAQGMQEASAREDYEAAALFRDKIKALTAVQSRQDIEFQGAEDADVFGVTCQHGKSCVDVFFFRGGRNQGNRPYFPRHAPDDSVADILAAFLVQFYENKPVPPLILISHDVAEKGLIEQALSSRLGRKVRIAVPQRGARRRILDFAVRNARAALDRHHIASASEEKLLKGVADVFGLDEMPRRIEVYDNSHTGGQFMIGAMIVAGAEGFQKNAYRKFNIRHAVSADDVGMMREVLTRRFSKALAEDPDLEGGQWPDLVLIDGGKAQYNTAQIVLNELGIDRRIRLVAIAKGEDRNAGRETFFVGGRKPFQLPVNDPVLYYLQRLRDEAHRFAIGTHRARRQKQISASPLDDVPGIGAKRKKALLLHFGSAKAVSQASAEDLQAVQGVSKAMARQIYEHFH